MSTYPTGDTAQASTAQIYAWAVAAGFPPPAAIIATAITYPESGGHPGVVQSGEPYATTGWGLWQITPGDSVPSVGVDDALLDGATNARAAFAKYSGAGSTFRPWTTYQDGAYKAWLSQAEAAASGAGPGASLGGTVSGSGIDTALGGALAANVQNGAITGGPGDIHTIIGGNLPGWLQNTWNAITSIPEAFTYTFQWLSGPIADLDKLITSALWLFNPANWVRIFLGLIGAGLIIFGGVLVATS